VVGGERRFEAVLGQLAAHPHTARVVDQQIDPVERVGGRVDRPQRGQVQRQGLDAGSRHGRADAVRGVRGLGGVAAGEHDGGAAAGEARRRVEAETGVGAGDHGDPAGLVRDVLGGPAAVSRSACLLESG
jgi:hypothetical protein